MSFILDTVDADLNQYFIGIIFARYTYNILSKQFKLTNG